MGQPRQASDGSANLFFLCVSDTFLSVQYSLQLGMRNSNPHHYALMSFLNEIMWTSTILGNQPMVWWLVSLNGSENCPDEVRTQNLETSGLVAQNGQHWRLNQLSSEQPTR
jgi:hypothetical protein